MSTNVLFHSRIAAKHRDDKDKKDKEKKEVKVKEEVNVNHTVNEEHYNAEIKIDIKEVK